MAFVVDASVTMAWCFEDESSSATESILERLIDEPAVVPALWTYEIANVLLTAERRGRIAESAAARFVALLAELPITPDPAPPDLEAILYAGRRHGLTSYDASYLVLAQREGLGLATTDERLRVAAQAGGVVVLA